MLTYGTYRGEDRGSQLQISNGGKSEFSDHACKEFISLDFELELRQNGQVVLRYSPELNQRLHRSLNILVHLSSLSFTEHSSFLSLPILPSR